MNEVSIYYCQHCCHYLHRVLSFSKEKLRLRVRDLSVVKPGIKSGLPEPGKKVNVRKKVGKQGTWSHARRRCALEVEDEREENLPGVSTTLWFSVFWEDDH